MPRAPTPWADEFTLLCERCGYVIEGLPTDGACPECGKPVAESLPGRRGGTPWQKHPSIRSLLRTWWMTLRHPFRTLDVMRFDEVRWFGLLTPTLLISAGLCWVAVCAEGFSNPAAWLIGSVFFGLFTLCLVAILFFLSGIESLGLQFFSRRKGTRITQTIAWTIVGHGAVGWMVTFAVWLIGWKFSKFYEVLHPAETEWELRQRVVFVAEYILFPTFVGGFATGLLLFETFAWLGLRRLRYANRLRPPGPDGSVSAGR